MFSLPIDNADEYPMSQPVSDFANTITIQNTILAENINRSIFATAQDELRPVMNGIYFDLTPDCLCVVASDGHKLVRNKIFTIKSDQPTAFILPKKPANLLTIPRECLDSGALFPPAQKRSEKTPLASFLSVESQKLTLITSIFPEILPMSVSRSR